MSDIFSMSDAEIMNMTAPPAPAVVVDTSTVDETTQTTEETTPVNTTAAVVVEDETTTDTVDDVVDPDKVVETVTETTDGGATGTDDGNVVTTGGEQTGKPEEVKTEGTAGTQDTQKVETTDEQVQTPDYKAFYEGAMAPIKANGKTVEIKSPEDLRTLAQMGLNYTQKMQQIAPIRKVGMMLQDHGLLDETKLSFLIDLHNKKPEAIRQLIKDAGIDPLEIDTSADTGYTPSNHAVSPEELAFRTKVQDLRSSTEGQATIDTIHGTWDDASKQHLWANPDVADIIHEHRTTGLYDRVAGEVSRLQALGQIPGNVSFITAYQAVGADMGKHGLLDDLVPAKPEPIQPKQPIATRVVTKKPETSTAKVAAAVQTTTSVKKAETKINPLDMSDADFEAHLQKVRGY